MAHQILLLRGQLGKRARSRGQEKNRIVSESLVPLQHMADHPVTLALSNEHVPLGVRQRNDTAKGGLPFGGWDVSHAVEQTLTALAWAQARPSKPGGVDSRLTTQGGNL
jgi:hypothetical protein